jgi:conjugative transfer region protein TrbK
VLAIKLWRVVIVAVVVGESLAVPHRPIERNGEAVLRVEPASANRDELDEALIWCRDLDQQDAIKSGCLDVWDRNFQRLLGQKVPALSPRTIAVVPSRSAR